MRRALAALVLPLVALSVWLKPERVVPETFSAERIQPPSREVLQLVALEHRHALSDLLWLQVLQNFGRKRAPPGLWNLVERDLWLAIGLDPRNETPYIGGFVIAHYFARDIEWAEEVLRAGIEAIPNSAKLWTYLGFLHYFVKGQPKEASEYWAQAAKLPGVPRYVGSLAALARYQAGDDENAVKIIEELLAHTDETDPAFAYLEFTRDELLTEERLERFDAACVAFRAQRGRWPASAEELVAAGFVREPPVDVRGHPIELDIDERRGRPCVARTEFIDYRQFERAQDMVGSEKPEP